MMEAASPEVVPIPRNASVPNQAPFTWGSNWTKPPEHHCEVCGKFNPWQAPNKMMPWSPFRMCQDCLGHEPPYGECEIESGTEVIELTAKEKKLAAGKTCGEAQPRWRVQGDKLIVEPFQSHFHWHLGSW